MTFRMPRPTRSRGGQRLSAVLVLLYFWAFVALGLTHTHGAIPAAARRHAPGVACASAAQQFVARADLQPANDTPCALCTAVHAAPAAMPQPPAPAYPLLGAQSFALWSPDLTPKRTPRISRSRAPPQV